MDTDVKLHQARLSLEAARACLSQARQALQNTASAAIIAHQLRTDQARTERLIVELEAVIEKRQTQQVAV